MSIAKDCIGDILKACERAQKCNDILNGDLSKSDLAIQDILHYIEFEDINTVLAYAAVKKIKELRELRRKIKNELEPLQILLALLDLKALDNIKKKVDKRVEHQNDRIYTPRVLKNELYYDNASNQ